MGCIPIVMTLLLIGSADPLVPGDHTRTVEIGGVSRTYLLHVPPSYDPQKETPVVLALHPFATNGPMMARISGSNRTSDREGFLVAYPNGTGRAGILHWNVGLGLGDEADDVGYIRKVLDDLGSIAKVDAKRVYATGFSNGAMMCYRLASELSNRIAAIAPVAGTMITPELKANRPISVLHFHGTKDTFVSYTGQVWRAPRAPKLPGVEETLQRWSKHDGCPETPRTVEIPAGEGKEPSIQRITYGPGREDSEVVLYRIDGGGHTWPGQKPIGEFLGKTAIDLKANDLIWEFFQKHPRP